MKAPATATIIAALAATAAPVVGAEPPKMALEALSEEIHLGGPRTAATQRFEMESRLMMHAPDGAITTTDVYRLALEITPAERVGTDGDLCRCTSFTVQMGSAPAASVPALQGWTYLYRHANGAPDANGRTLGIPHEPFEKLVDAAGTPLPAGNAYHVYNAFIDFHAFGVFAERSARGPGVQDLTRVGQRIVRAKAGSTAATDVGQSAGKGSHFTNGEITLALKGLSLVNGTPCAIVGYDSGASSFLMLATPMPGMDVRTVGSSHYHGDIFVDLDGGWIQEATLTEMVVSQTTVPGAAAPINGVIERVIEVRNVTAGAARR
jgi:hypothetical protein